MHMTRMLIRVDGELTEELVSAFPHLTTKIAPGADHAGR